MVHISKEVVKISSSLRNKQRTSVKKIIDKLKTRLSTADISEYRRVTETVRSGKIQFMTILGQDFLEELEENQIPADAASIEEIPAFSGDAYVAVNGNIPFFVEEEYTTESYEYYGELDELGRCTTVIACVGKDIMPTEERGNIGQVKPTGWHTVKYENVDGKYLYNRCHLIGFQLTGENANDRNLITGTRYLNVEGMLPFENMIADYVKETETSPVIYLTSNPSRVSARNLYRSEGFEEYETGVFRIK